MMGMALQQTGQYEIREENNATHTVSAAREFRPDVVLLDVMMPEADGGDIAGDLKADDLTAHIPIIFLTALVGNEETSLGGLLSGGHRFLPKPVSLAELTQCIEEVTRKTKTE
jgi:DNA-binding response OmpR family regulator